MQIRYCIEKCILSRRRSFARQTDAMERIPINYAQWRASNNVDCKSDLRRVPDITQRRRHCKRNKPVCKHLIFRLLRRSIVEWQPRFAYPPICWKSRSGYRQVFRSNIHVPLSNARGSRRVEAADSSLPKAKRVRIFHGITNCQLKYDKHGIVW